MYKKIVILILANLLFLMGYSYSQDEIIPENAIPPEEKNGLIVAVYDLGKEEKDIEAAIAYLLDRQADSLYGLGIDLIYSSSDTSVHTMNSNQWKNFPATLSISKDFRNLKTQLRENFLIHWRGKIKIPKGWFAMHLKHADDLALVYLYKDKENEGIWTREQPAFAKGNFFSWKGFNYLLKRKHYGWENYFEKEEIYNIDIFFVQKKGDFRLEIKTVIGHTLEKILLKSGKREMSSLTNWDNNSTAEWKNLHELKEYLIEPALEVASEDISDEELEEDTNLNYEIPPQPRFGFKGEIIKIPHSEIPMQDYKRASEAANSGGSPNSEYAKESKERGEKYWQRECEDCPYNALMPTIITVGEKLLKEGRTPHIGMYMKTLLYAVSELEEEIDNNFLFSTFNNNSLDINTEDFPRMNQDIALFNQFKEAFLWVEENRKSVMDKDQERDAELTAKYTGKPHEIPSFSKDQIKDYTERFEDFIGVGLFMTLIKFSGKIRLPEGFLKMRFNGSVKNGASVFLNKNHKGNGFIYAFENSGAPSRHENIFRSQKNEIVEIEIYLFHYAGPMEMKVEIDLDGKGFKDLWYWNRFIVQEDEAN